MPDLKSDLKKLTVLLFALTLVACDGSNVTVSDVSRDDRSTGIDRVDQSDIVAEPERITEQTTGPVAIAVDSSTDIVPSAPAPAPAPATGAASITDVVLVTGQSNALGSETGFDPVLDQPVDRVYAYTDNGWEPASLRQVWDLAWHPAKGLGDDPHNNFGFHFGKTIARLTSDRVVGIILVTAPGEGISHWDSNGHFFRKIRNKALLALNDLPQKSGIDGILWHQGETDWTKSGTSDPSIEVPAENDYYSHKLWALINNFRSEVWFGSDRPFICGETSRSPVNTRLNALNRDADNRTACVPGVGLPTYDEQRVHFSAEGLRQLGANYAEVYLQMTR